MKDHIETLCLERFLQFPPHYLLNNGTGWTNDTGIDSNSHIPGGSAQSTPTVLNSVPSDFIRESATFYPNTTLKIRKAPTESDVDTGLIYAPGMSVCYDGYVKREGFVWISASTGERRWMKAGVLNSKDTIPIHTEDLFKDEIYKK